MTARRFGFWFLQSAAAGLLVAGGSWALLCWSVPNERDIGAVRSPVVVPPGDERQVADLAWSLRHEGVADAVREVRPDPYIPAEPRPSAPPPAAPVAPAASAEPSEAAAEEPAPDAAWAAPLAAVLKASPPRPSRRRPVLRMISLGPAASGIAVDASAPAAAAAAASEPAPPSRAAEASAAATDELARPARAARRAFVSAAPAPSAPTAYSGLANQQGTDYGEADAPTD